MSEKQIKMQYARIFSTIDNCSWQVYLKLKQMELNDIEKINRKAAQSMLRQLRDSYVS